MACTSYCSEREPVEPRSRPVLVLALFAVGDVYVSLCKKIAYRRVQEYKRVAKPLMVALSMINDG